MSDCGAADGLPAWLTCQRWHLVGTGPIRGARLAPADFEDTGDVSGRHQYIRDTYNRISCTKCGVVWTMGYVPAADARCAGDVSEWQPAAVTDLVSAQHAPYAYAPMVPAHEMIPDHSDDIEFELIKPGWVIVPGSGRVTVGAEARDRMVAAAMTWHRQHTVVPWHELISEARMRELVEAMLREAGDG